MSFKDDIKVNTFSDCYIEEVECDGFCTSLMQVRHYYLKNPSGKILAEYESRYYPLDKSAELGYWRVDQSEDSKGCVTYGFKQICSLLFAKDTLYIFLRINDENKKSLNIARNSGFIRKAENDDIYIRLNPRAEEIIKNSEKSDLLKSMLLEFIGRFENKIEENVIW